MIETAETRFGTQIVEITNRPSVRGGWDLPPPELWAAIVNQPEGGYDPPVGAVDAPTVTPHVNYGRWLVRCPLCNANQHAARGDWFYCAMCNNRSAGHRMIPQEWPANATEIEDQLAKRPDRSFQHWNHGETIADLQRQDDDAGASGLLHSHLQN